MKKIITVLAIVTALLTGYLIGSYTKDIENVEVSADGVQIQFHDGTGYWYEY